MKPQDFWKDAIYYVDGAEYNVDEKKLEEAFYAFHKRMQTEQKLNIASVMQSYIHNPLTVDDFANNANVQMGNIEYYLSVKEYESALIKAHCLVSELQDIMALKIGSELFNPNR